ncbi:hypothetical protein PAMP_013197 [Pampus punctatissimus]
MACSKTSSSSMQNEVVVYSPTVTLLQRFLTQNRNLTLAFCSPQPAATGAEREEEKEEEEEEEEEERKRRMIRWRRRRWWWWWWEPGKQMKFLGRRQR